MVIYSGAILVIVTSECSAKKTWTGAFAKGADLDQTPQNAASNQGVDCMLKLQEVKDSIKQSYLPV